MTSPKYFFAMFGDPRPPEKDSIESGIYHPDPSISSQFPTERKDQLFMPDATVAILNSSHTLLSTARRARLP